MYFPSTAARQLSSVPLLPHLPPEPIIALRASPSKSLFCTITRNGVAVWRVRPSVILSYLSRTPTSVAEHGENASICWSPDGTRLIIQTIASYLVLVTITYDGSSNAVPYEYPALPASAQRLFRSGSGEAMPIFSASLTIEGVIRVEGELLSVSPRKRFLLFSTKNPPAVQRIPWPSADQHNDDDGPNPRYSMSGHDTWILNDDELPWLVDANVTVSQITYSRSTGVETWITSDGRAYFVQLQEVSYRLDASTREESQSSEDDHTQADQNSEPPSLIWQGICVHDVHPPKWMQKQKAVETNENGSTYHYEHTVVRLAINSRFSLIAIGTASGTVELVNFPDFEGSNPRAHALQLPDNSKRSQSGSVCTMEWSSDGYVLAVGWEHGWAVWSAAGRCLTYGFGLEDEADHDRFQDHFMFGILDLFWGQGNFELIALSHPSPNRPDGQLFVIPFAKSAVTEQQTPDNTRYAFLQMDDRVLIYRGADQPDMSVINPESDVWQHVQIPLDYLASNWPIRYSAISVDGRLVAVAGRRGLVHYSTTSGRWKLFGDSVQEQAFAVRGGLLWFHHVLVAAVEVAKSYQIRLYSRDLELSTQDVLHREFISSPVVTLSLVDNSLLVYTADNALSHYLIVPTSDSIQLHLCGSISFDGIINVPSVVRGLSWMIPNAQKQLGDPMDDLSVATVLMMVGGKLVLLRPRKSGQQEVKYDMQILADRIEFCWIHLRGIGALENSLWGYDGSGIRIWLNALSIESHTHASLDTHENVQESVKIPLDFYPLSVLMDKGIIIGVEPEIATRVNLPYVLFRHTTTSQLFLHHILRAQLQTTEIHHAVTFASHYAKLTYFSHVLEILLHTVVESEADTAAQSSDEEGTSDSSELRRVVEFLDHFGASLDVVVRCARKTEMARWKRLFDVVGSPKALFETCLTMNQLKTAASYLLVSHNLDGLGEDHGDAIRLLQRALEARDWQLCQELLRFFHSIDDTGVALRHAITETKILSLQPEVQDGLSDGAGLR